VRGLVAGDPRATREAWRRFGPMVRRILLRTLGPDSELEDLSQEVFITFFDRVKTLRDPETLTAFIMSITAFKIRHHLRWRWLRRRLVLRGQGEKLELRTFQRNAEAREALVGFFKILDRLNAVDRTVFTLRFVEELELREVAVALDLSLPTTKRRLTRTWKRLACLVRTDPALGDLLSGFDKGIEGGASA
jgi:RNA polymerase sigma-70 factor, ECF subfamily